MTIRLFFLSFMFIGWFSSSYSQVYLGFQTGIAQNYLQTNIQNRPGVQYKSGYGLFATIPAEWRFELQKGKPISTANPKGSFIKSAGLAFDLSLTFIQKSYALNRTDSLLQSLNTEIRNDYLQLPFSVGYYAIRNKMTLFVSGGGYIGYWLGGRIQGGIPNLLNGSAPYPQTFSYNEKYTFDSNRDKRWEWGWQFCVGLSYKANEMAEPYIGFHFYQSLTDQQKQYMTAQVPRYNQTFAFSIGLIVNLKNLKK